MRRNILAVLLLALLLLPCPALAGEATDTLKQSVDRVIAVLSNPDYKDPAKRPAQRKDIIAIVKGIFDFEELSMRTVGPHWSGFTDAEKKDFMAAFEDLLSETYLGRIQDYSDEKVEYLRERPNNKGDKVEVQTQVVTRDKQIPIHYRMTQNDKWVVYDVIIEGVSLVKNYRTQFQELLQKGTAEELIAKVRERTAELQKENGNSK